MGSGSDIDTSKFEGHTPGPWHWNYDKIDRGKNKGNEVYANLAAPRQGCEQSKYPLFEPVLTPNWNEFDGGTWQAWVSVNNANAALIAAAPRLLAENARLRKELAEARKPSPEAVATMERLEYALLHPDRDCPATQRDRMLADLATLRREMGMEAE